MIYSELVSENPWLETAIKQLNELKPDTVVGTFFHNILSYKDKPFILANINGKENVITWFNAAAGILLLASKLKSLGLSKDTRVVILSENRFEWIISDLAIQCAQGTTVPIYATLTPTEIAKLLEDCTPSYAFVSNEKQFEKLLHACNYSKVTIKGIYSFDPFTPAQTGLSGSINDLIYRANVAETDITDNIISIQPADICTIIYTSGTTGEPKGVMLSHANFAKMAEVCLAAFSVTPTDIALSFLPYSHVFERMSSIFICIAAKATLALARGPDTLIDDFRLYNPTVMVCVPRVYEKMYAGIHAQVNRSSFIQRALFYWAKGIGINHLDMSNASMFKAFINNIFYWIAEKLVFKKIKILVGNRFRFFISGGAPLASHIERFFFAVGIKIFQGYGLTETTSGATANTPTAFKFGSIGKPFKGTQIKISEDGEICINGPGVMVGYYNKPMETSKVLVDGWLYTGDIGYVDNDGFLYITDRKKDLIITSGGKNIAPQPIEQRLMAYEEVANTVVVGNNRPYIVALIEPNLKAIRNKYPEFAQKQTLLTPENQDLIDIFQKIVDQVNKELASFETIKYFRLLPEPLEESKGEITPTLKVKRTVVEQNYKSLIDSMYQS
jgi:long-chain acyl-CoA synthetase